VKKIRRSSEYKKWVKNLKDARARARVFARVKRLSEGNPGDSQPIGEGFSEMRIDYGTGYRVYYKETGNEIVILLCGGDKSTQSRDIARAKDIFKEYKSENEEEED
jgi:putative addiction module killer protein